MELASVAFTKCQYDEAVQNYRLALEYRARCSPFGEFSPENTYSNYGRALLHQAGAVEADFAQTTHNQPPYWTLEPFIEKITKEHTDTSRTSADILLAMAEIADEEDKKLIAATYMEKALCMLEQLDAPESLKAEINFKICRVLLLIKPREAERYCERAFCICESSMAAASTVEESKLMNLQARLCVVQKFLSPYEFQALAFSPGEQD